MYPELLRIGPFVISSYGLFLALAFLAGIYIASRLAGRRGIDADAVINISLVIMVSAIIGSRLLYVLTHLDEFRGRWLYTVVPLRPDGSIGLGGLILLGGVLGAILAGSLYARHRRLPYWPLADSIAPALAFGLFLGRIGCFLNGCCYGKTCNLPWGVKFPPESAATYIMGHQALHPTQLYSSGYALLIFAVLMWLESRKPFAGLLSGVFLMLYGIARFSVDFFRYYERQMFFFGTLDLNQLISIMLFLSGGLILYIRRQAQT